MVKMEYSKGGLVVFPLIRNEMLFMVPDLKPYSLSSSFVTRNWKRSLSTSPLKVVADGPIESSEASVPNVAEPKIVIESGLGLVNTGSVSHVLPKELILST